MPDLCVMPAMTSATINRFTLEQNHAGGSRLSESDREDMEVFIASGTLIEKEGFLVFTKDPEFTSPSAAAVVIHGGSANGLAAWKTKDGKSLKQLDEQV